MTSPVSRMTPAARWLGAGLLALSLAGAAQATTAVEVQTTGVESLGLLGEDGNTVLQISIGAFSQITSLAWSVQLEAFAPSTLGELQVSFGSSSGLDALTLAPAAGDGFSGIGSYGGTVDLQGLGLAAGADGLLRIEFSEAYKDAAAGVADGRWLSGALRFEISPVPEPASAGLALAGVALVALFAGRRRQPQPPATRAPRSL
jgi:MYXO-CTERM domain-containing protein